MIINQDHIISRIFKAIYFTNIPDYKVGKVIVDVSMLSGALGILILILYLMNVDLFIVLWVWFCFSLYLYIYYIAKKPTYSDLEYKNFYNLYSYLDGKHDVFNQDWQVNLFLGTIFVNTLPVTILAWIIYRAINGYQKVRSLILRGFTRNS